MASGGLSNFALNQTNLVTPGSTFSAQITPSPYNTFTLQVPTGANLKDKQVALEKIEIYYSWPNISTTFNNSSYVLNWPTPSSTGRTAYTVNLIPTGRTNINIDSIATLNTNLQSFMTTNGMYLIDGNGNNVYYAQWVANPSTYAVDLLTYPVPTSLPSGYNASQPQWIGYPNASITPSITISSTNNFGALIGYAAGTYGAGTVAAVVEGTYTAQLNPVSSIYISLNIAYNSLSLNNSPTIVYTFSTPTGTNFGNIIEVEPKNLAWYDINTTSTSFIQMTLTDQNMNALNILDPQTNAQFLIRNKPKE
jgi:hypothetical protein